MVIGSFLMNSLNRLLQAQIGYWQQFLIIGEIPYFKGFRGLDLHIKFIFYEEQKL